MEKDQIFSQLTQVLRPEFDRLLVQESDTPLWIRDVELQTAASCCTQGEVASFYLLDWFLHGGDGKRIASQLMDDVLRRQLSNGAFGQPFYIKQGEPEKVDIAEIGAVANSLFQVAVHAHSESSRMSLVKAADYLLTQVAKENPGAIYKNPGITIDVLNGNIYGAHTLGRAFQLTGSSIYREKGIEIVQHVMSRFGKHTPGWWHYTENWDGSLDFGNSVSYQATIIGFAYTLLPLLPDQLKKEWQEVVYEAIHTIFDALQGEPNDEVEAPWWARDWKNEWEIYLALWRYRDRKDCNDYVMQRLQEVLQDIEKSGIEYFRPEISKPDPDRSPVATTFRKAATFAGILSYMWLDENRVQEMRLFEGCVHEGCRSEYL